jgi:hypothetical protein
MNTNYYTDLRRHCFRCSCMVNLREDELDCGGLGGRKLYVLTRRLTLSCNRSVHLLFYRNVVRQALGVCKLRHGILPKREIDILCARNNLNFSSH